MRLHNVLNSALFNWHVVTPGTMTLVADESGRPVPHKTRPEKFLEERAEDKAEMKLIQAKCADEDGMAHASQMRVMEVVENGGFGWEEGPRCYHWRCSHGTLLHRIMLHSSTDKGYILLFAYIKSQHLHDTAPFAHKRDQAAAFGQMDEWHLKMVLYYVVC